MQSLHQLKNRDAFASVEISGGSSAKTGPALAKSASDRHALLLPPDNSLHACCPRFQTNFPSQRAEVSSASPYPAPRISSGHRHVFGRGKISQKVCRCHTKPMERLDNRSSLSRKFLSLSVRSILYRSSACLAGQQVREYFFRSPEGPTTQSVPGSTRT